MKINKLLFILFWIVFASTPVQAQTAAVDSPFFFIQLTDTQFGMFADNREFVKESALYEQAVEQINRLKPAFVVITGDLVNDGKDTEQINEFKRITAKIDANIPVWLLPGNHDVGNSPDSLSLAAYKKQYGYDRFAFHHHTTLFIGINSSLIKAGTPGFEQEQERWLKKQLAKSRKYSQVILFTHYPFFLRDIEEEENYSTISPAKRKHYFDRFTARKVKAIFAGHLHHNSVASYNGIEVVATSALSKPLGDAPSGMRIIKVFNDTIEHRYYGLEELPSAIAF